jgi:hypothetical protein
MQAMARGESAISCRERFLEWITAVDLRMVGYATDRVDGLSLLLFQRLAGTDLVRDRRFPAAVVAPG